MINLTAKAQRRKAPQRLFDRKRFALVASALLIQAVSVFAAENLHPELPPTEVVAHLLRTSPMVTAAASLLRAEEANRARLDAGPHEWTLRLARQQRDVRAPEPAQRFAEWDAGLERPLRLPGKAGTDAALGAAGVDMARIAQGDALHESSRLLMKIWFDWLRARDAARETRLQADLLGRQEKGVQRRHQLGDAARLEAVQAEAASAQAEAQSREAQSREAAARLALQKRFPGLPLAAADLELPAPQPLQGSTEGWLAAILEHNHELGVARAEARKARLSARRSDQETVPDPTVGVRVARERGGEERLAALTLSFALPGAARRGTADMAVAQADAAAAREAAMQLKVEAEAASLVESARLAHAAWQGREAAAQRLGEAADMTARAHALGEAGLAETLAARRLSFDARLSARLARLDALELADRLLLDAHRLWPLDADDDEQVKGEM